MRTIHHVAFWTTGIILLVLLLYMLNDVLMPFVVGVAIAYFVDPLADRLEARGMSRQGATIAIIIFFVLIWSALLAVFLPVLYEQLVGFIDRTPVYVENLKSTVVPLFQDLDLDVIETFDKLRSSVQEHMGTITQWLGRLVSGVLSGGAFLANFLSLLFLTPLVTFYMLRDWDRIVAAIDDLLPRRNADTIRALVRQIDETLAGFVRGQASVCLVLGFFYAVTLSVIGLDFGLLIGLGAGLVSFIPFVGALLGFLVGVAVAFFQFGDWLQVGLVTLVFGIGQILEGNFLTPKLVGEKVGLHPLWVVFALLAGGTIFGFVGVMLSVPVAAVIGVLTRFAIIRYRASLLYQGSGPEQPSLEAGGGDAG